MSPSRNGAAWGGWLPFLMGLRMFGWLLAWVGLAGAFTVSFRLVRERPATWDGVLAVARTGRAAPPRREAPPTPAANARHAAARSLVQDGALARGEAFYRRLLTEVPDHAQFNQELGELLLDEGRVTEAVRWLERAVVVSPDEGRGFARLAEARLRSGDRTGGAAARRRARDLGADVRRFDRQLAGLLLAESRFDAAIELFLSVDPEGQDVDVQVLLGTAFYEKGRRRLWNPLGDQEAIRRAGQHVARALALDPAHPEALKLREAL